MAKKLESTLLNMVISLTVIASISALALAFTFESTKDKIAEAKSAKTLAAIGQVVPAFDNDPAAEKFSVEGFDRLEFYPAKKDGNIVGVAVKTVAGGFTEDVWIMVGFDAEGKIHNTSVLEHKETPGLGTKMAEPKFKDQFLGLDMSTGPVKVTKDGGKIDAISAATISSRAFCDATQLAYNALVAWKKSNAAKGGK